MERSKFGRLIPHFGQNLTTQVGCYFELCNGRMSICLEEGLRTKDFKIMRSKSNAITFYTSLGMCNQVETQMERHKGLQFSNFLCIICLEGGWSGVW